MRLEYEALKNQIYSNKHLLEKVGRLEVEKATLEAKVQMLERAEVELTDMCRDKDAEIDELSRSRHNEAVENNRLKGENATHKHAIDAILKDLFGTNSILGMVAIKDAIKKKMDRHEKTKEANAGLRKENIDLISTVKMCNKTFAGIHELTNETKTSGNALSPLNRVELLKEAYNNQTLNLDTLRLHLGKTARGRELLRQFDRAKKGK